MGMCSDRKRTYMKPIGLETVSLLMRLAFFDDTRPGDGKLLVGQIRRKGALLDSGKSSYRGPATTSGGGSTPAPQRIREGDGVRISTSKSEKPLCNRVPP